MKNKLKHIIDNYGIMPQLKYFQSEVFELNEAIINYENSLKEPYAVNMLLLKKHIAEEIADVLVMLKQFQLYYNISSEDIKNIMKYKINRQIERIEMENIEND